VIGASHFGSLPAELKAALCSRARAIEIPAGDTRRREGDDHEHLDIVADGTARVYVSAPDGRTRTVRYCHAGAIVSTISLYSRPFEGFQNSVAYRYQSDADDPGRPIEPSWNY
jgi:CRP/FNR family cyclic AMP-dependent transcriptional regulator